MAFHNPSNCQKNKDLILKMLDEGKSLTKIASAVKTNGRHVQTFLKKLGMTHHFPLGTPGAKHPNWKGGRLIDKSGYVLVISPRHPEANNAGYVREHRLVMETFLGRPLLPDEVVHHKNDVYSDNRVENLEVFPKNSEHLRATLIGQVPNWTEDGIRRMKEGIARSAKLRRPGTRILSGQDVREWR